MFRLAFALCASLLISTSAFADGDEPAAEPAVEGAAVEGAAPQQAPPTEEEIAAMSAQSGIPVEMLNRLLNVEWTAGPTDGSVGSMATVQVPEGLRYTSANGTRTMLEFWGNPTNGSEMALIEPIAEEQVWSAIFEWDESGYVEDTGHEDLDADEMLKSIRAGTEQGNKLRVEMGSKPLTVDGWAIPPKYDPATNHLIWATRASTEDGSTVNYNVRLLGRRGVMSAVLLTDPASLDVDRLAFESLLTGFGFNADHRYGDFKQGDQIAKYGLAALVAGGVGAAAVKSGLLARFWKFIVLGFVAVGGFLKRFFGGGERVD